MTSYQKIKKENQQLRNQVERDRLLLKAIARELFKLFGTSIVLDKNELGNRLRQYRNQYNRDCEELLERISASEDLPL